LQFTEAALIVVLAPAVLMPLINYWTVRSFWDWHNSWLGRASRLLHARDQPSDYNRMVVLCAASFTGTTTNIVKITVGRPRPGQFRPTLALLDST
jgi:diacylglycerol diphosphate phosphatase / phosphatidate phosphatase